MHFLRLLIVWHSFGYWGDTPNLTKLRILIINENQRLLSLLSNCLQEGGHEVYTTNNPLDTPHFISEKNPDLILMNLLVSYLTCFELISQIRAWPDKYIKIIVMTRINQENVIEQVFEMGVDDYILLPLKKKELIARISRLERYILAS